MGCLAVWIWFEKNKCAQFLSGHIHAGKGAIAKSGKLFTSLDEAVVTSDALTLTLNTIIYINL